MQYQFPTVFPVTCHTDFVGKGTTFVAIQGYRQNGNDYIPLAISKGASTVVIEEGSQLSQEVSQQLQEHHIAVRYVASSRKALAEYSAHALDYPAKKLNIIGVTGTKGKTTTTFLLEHILATAGYTTALSSTVHNKIGNYYLPKNLTTPQPDYLQMFLSECVRLGITWVVMEVAAQALSLHRVEGIEFDGIIFTNFSQEHAEFYATQEDYFKAKCAIFEHAKKHAPVILNADDPRYSFLSGIQHTSVSVGDAAALYKGVVIADSLATGLVVDITHTKTDRLHIPALSGTFNAYNICMAFALIEKLGIEPGYAIQAYTTFAGVPGRLERYTLPNGALGIIDHAHTASSFEAILYTARQSTDHLIVVFGAGGNRDALKRPVMGAIAYTYADIVIITTDNPRNESLDNIIRDILLGIEQPFAKPVIIELDREAAIKKAYALSRSGTIIAILGKGSDEYQEIRGVKIHFSERSILASL